MHGSNTRSLLVLVMVAGLSTMVQADAIDDFLAQHWQRPLLPQGEPPPQFSEREGSLAAKDCGSCHPKQHADWSQSRHSKAMGSGLMGQLIDMPAHARDDHQSCLRCHAPLAEQANALVDEITTDDSSGLHRDGLICAACHVRQHQRFGPVRKDGSAPNRQTVLPHDGWVVTDAFEDSRFCAACHQFQPDQFSLNGKLLEDTYNEWSNSRYGRDGISCQSCHMPDRRHLWRGIHDPAMVRQGVEISARLAAPQPEVVTATLTIKNSGTGHRFPTYVTPQVVLEAYQQNEAGERIDGTEAYFVIARRVALDLSQEIFDTRLAPGQSAQLDYQQPRNKNAVALITRIWVQPDFFYQQFYASVLDSGRPQRGRAELQQALDDANNSRYTLFEQRLELASQTIRSSNDL